MGHIRTKASSYAQFSAVIKLAKIKRTRRWKFGTKNLFIRQDLCFSYPVHRCIEFCGKFTAGILTFVKFPIQETLTNEKF